MTLAERVIVGIVAVLLGVALMLVTTSCARTAVMPPVHALFEVHNSPKPATPWCQLDDPPKPPELIEMDGENRDVMDRVMIHRREWRELLDYLFLVSLWEQQANTCLGKLTE